MIDRKAAEAESLAATRFAQGEGLLIHRKLDQAIRDHLDSRGIPYSKRMTDEGIRYSTSARMSMTPQQAADTFLPGGFDGFFDDAKESTP